MNKVAVTDLLLSLLGRHSPLLSIHPQPLLRVDPQPLLRVDPQAFLCFDSLSSLCACSFPFRFSFPFLLLLCFQLFTLHPSFTASLSSMALFFRSIAGLLLHFVDDLLD